MTLYNKQIEFVLIEWVKFSKYILNKFDALDEVLIGLRIYELSKYLKQIIITCVGPTIYIFLCVYHSSPVYLSLGECRKWRTKRHSQKYVRGNTSFLRTLQSCTPSISSACDTHCTDNTNISRPHFILAAANRLRTTNVSFFDHATSLERVFFFFPLFYFNT